MVILQSNLYIKILYSKEMRPHRADYPIKDRNKLHSRFVNEFEMFSFFTFMFIPF